MGTNGMQREHLWGSWKGPLPTTNDDPHLQRPPLLALKFLNVCLSPLPRNMFPANLVEATFKQVRRAGPWRGGTGDQERQGCLSMVVTQVGTLPVSYLWMSRKQGSEGRDMGRIHILAPPTVTPLCWVQLLIKKLRGAEESRD